MGDIRKLREAVEAGTATGGPDAWVVPREMSDLIQIVTGDDDELWSAFVGAHDGSLDDANALHDALVPEWVVTIERVNSGRWIVTLRLEPRVGTVRADCDNGARAWLLAILRAMKAEGRG